MQMRCERNRAGLQELQDKLAVEAKAQVTGEGLTEEQRTIYSTIGSTPHLAHLVFMPFYRFMFTLQLHNAEIPFP